MGGWGRNRGREGVPGIGGRDGLRGRHKTTYWSGLLLHSEITLVVRVHTPLQRESATSRREEEVELLA